MVSESKVGKSALKCMLVNVGGRSDFLGINSDDDGRVIEVVSELTSEGWLNFSLPQIAAISNEVFKVGAGALVVGFVLKYGEEDIEIQTIYSGQVEAEPFVCCHCGRVKVCGYGCSCY